MLGKLNGWDDTIIALATPPGIGAIGVIRLSGPESLRLVNALFPSKDLEAQASHTLHVGLLKQGDDVLDEVVVAIYRGPRSYTGEDVVEISCHGSPYVQERCIQALSGLGARLAKPGEFTQRAFLNGKLDLTQAEAVADLIASNTAASAKAALHTIKGGFARDLMDLRDQLLSFSALIELELDFSQEDVEFADRKQLYDLIRRADHTTAALLQSFRLGNVIRNGVQVAIIGKPNAGKSTLLNTLLNENRAIVSAIAGTTRDTIEEVLNIEGILFRLIDTAGIRGQTTAMTGSRTAAMIGGEDAAMGGGRTAAMTGVQQGDRGTAEKGSGGEGSRTPVQTFSGEGSRKDDQTAAKSGGKEDAWKAGTGEGTGKLSDSIDLIEQIGMEKSLEKMEQADIVLYLFDVSDSPEEVAMKEAELRAGGKKFLLVGNKVDEGDGRGNATDAGKTKALESAADNAKGSKMVGKQGDDAMMERFETIPGIVFISAKEHWHIDTLKERLVALVLEGNASIEGTVVTNARHYYALQQVAKSLQDISHGLDEKLSGDLLTLDIRRCLHYLGEITGEVTTEDQLGYIFGKFCIGK